MDLVTLARGIQTPSLAASTVNQHIDKIIRPINLERGTIYLMRERKSNGRVSDNLYSAVRYLGIGRTQKDVEWNVYPHNIPVSQLDTGVYYWFEGVNHNEETFKFSAYSRNARLVIGSSATNVSFYTVK